MSSLTLGSLFDGSGGFPLGAVFVGIVPVWASEVEPFPIRVTTKRLPGVKHLGDIGKIDGGKIAPVDIITFGSPCQDLSVAGRRAGLDDGERSSLFYEAVRVIKEMRCATDGRYPTYAVWENVPGAYSSNKGQDFRSVLEALLRIKDEALSVPMPESGKWSTSGEVVGDGISLAWRTLDAQFWGVPQRRARCYLVIDFAGESAGQILFNESRLSGDTAQGKCEGQGTAGGLAAGSGGAVAFEPGAASRLGGHFWDIAAPTLRADMGDNQTAVVYDARGNGDGQTASTITGDHESRVTDYTALVMNERQYALTVGEDVANTLTGTDYKGTQCVFEPKAYGICSFNSHSMLSANPHSGIYEAATSRTLDTSVPDPNKNAGGMAIVALEGNGSRPSHKGDGYSDEDVAYTLNSVERHAVCYQDKVGALCASDYKFPQSQQIGECKAIVERVACENHSYSGYRKVEKAGTLKASGGDCAGGESVVVENRYVVRRLTPTECARLQGFPQGWCAGLETLEPTDEDIVFWTDVFYTHARLNGKKPRSRNQIVKWLKDPHTDSAEYKMWGNGCALPCVVWVLSGIVYYGT